MQVLRRVQDRQPYVPAQVHLLAFMQSSRFLSMFFQSLFSNSPGNCGVNVERRQCDRTHIVSAENFKWACMWSDCSWVNMTMSIFLSQKGSFLPSDVQAAIGSGPVSTSIFCPSGVRSKWTHPALHPVLSTCNFPSGTRCIGSPYENICHN